MKNTTSMMYLSLLLLPDRLVAEVHGRHLPDSGSLLLEQAELARLQRGRGPHKVGPEVRKSDLQKFRQSINLPIECDQIVNVSLVLVLLAEAAGPLLVAGHLGLLARRAPDRAVVPLEGGGGHLPRVLTLVLLPGNVKYFCNLV